MKATVVLAGQEITVEVGDDGASAEVDGRQFTIRDDRSGPGAVITVGDETHVVDLVDAHTARIDGVEMPFEIVLLKGVAGALDPSTGTHGPIRPPMTGKLESLRVAAGDHVKQGQVLFVLEAMKMRNEVRAPADGVVGAVHAAEGASVDPGTVILDLTAADD